MNEDQIIIPFNKAKLWWLSFACAFFIILGFLFVLVPGDFKSPLINNLFMIRVLGFISLVLFGYFLGLYIPRLKDRGPALIIDENGITDHSSAISAGFIKWDDVTGIKRKTIASRKWIIVMVRNPEEYIVRSNSNVLTRALNSNLRLYGSPVAISSHELKCRFNELERLLKEAFQKRAMKSS